MDVSQDLAEYAAKHTTSVLERGVPIEVDAGLLAAFDTNPTDSDEYSSCLDPHLLTLTLSSTQSLLSSLFSLPTTSSSLGPVANLPNPTTILPREKPLPKPKVETKWERFAKAKGISHKTREKDVWDEEKQAFVPRWGRGGKNKEVEEQWIHEVKAGSDADLDPALTAKLARKSRIAKNLRQQSRNISEAASKPSTTGGTSSKSASARPRSKLTSTSSNAIPVSQADKKTAREIRKSELERSMLISKSSTASLGRFDKKIEGEPRVKGVKRKFDSAVEPSFEGEKKKALSVLASVGSEGRKKVGKKGGEGAEGGLNVRKAVRFNAREERMRGGGSGGSGGARGGRGGRGGKRY